jgi:RNA polymerase sigma factor (sigma-70 family)
MTSATLAIPARIRPPHRPALLSLTVEQTLLQRVAGGDESAVSETLDRFGGLVWSLARRFCGDRSDIEDAVQDIFVDVWKSAPRYDPQIASEATFVAMIARRRLIDRRRRKKVLPDVDAFERRVEENATAVAESSYISEDAQRAAAALKTLRPDQQTVLRMSILHGLSHDQIAKATGLPLGTVKTHVRRGLIRLRETLGVPGENRNDSPTDTANDDDSMAGHGASSTTVDRSAVDRSGGVNQ